MNCDNHLDWLQVFFFFFFFVFFLSIRNEEKVKVLTGLNFLFLTARGDYIIRKRVE